jgi:dihydrolipoamide dehydrogenase
VIGPPQLAHVASHEGIVCVEKIAGKSPHTIDYNSIPSCTYCQPQVASVGLTEEKCKEVGAAYRVGKFPFAASGKANAIAHTDGFVKLLFAESDDKLLGAYMLIARRRK